MTSARNSISKLLYFNSNVACINIHTSINSNLYSLVGLSYSFRKAKIISIENSSSPIEPPLGGNLVISITGEEVLSKLISPKNDDENIENLFPSVNLNEFYIQIFEGHDYNVVSLIRKTKLDKLLASYLTKQTCEIILGPFTAFRLFTVWNELSTITFSSKHYHYFQGNLKEVSPSSIEDDLPRIFPDLKSSFDKIAYANCMSLIYPGQYSITPILPMTVENTKELKYKFKAKRLLLFFSLGIFLALLLNALWFNSLSQKTETNNKIVNQYSLLRKQNDSVRKLINSNRELLRQFKINDNYRVAFCADRIAATVPNRITLHELKVFDVSRKFLSDSVDINRRYIHIQGKGSNKDLNIWIQNLRALSYINNIEINYFKPIDPYQDNNFSLSLLLNEFQN